MGLLAGAAYTMLSPPSASSTALVALPNSAPSVPTQVVIAESTPVLSAALPKVSPPVSLGTLRTEIKVKSLTSYILSITGNGKSAADAEATANAVANSYIAYVTPRYNLVGHVAARMFQPASTAAGPSLLAALASTALIGALAGALIGVIAALVIAHGDQRLRDRDDIANSIGVPVLAAVPVGHPSDAAGWTRLLENYAPGAVHAWQLRTALRQLGLTGNAVPDCSGISITVLSLASDLKALALGPQLAAFAASQGISTVLALGPQQDTNVTAALRTACAAQSLSSNRPGTLRVTISDDGGIEDQDAALIVAVLLVEAEKSTIPAAAPTTETVIGVSAGAATAEQLARVAVAAAADGRDISGILLADPDPSDRTSGRVPRPPQPRRGQVRSGRIAAETRR
jgi:capsular polysaccharide biosynthesis protein